MNGCTLRGGRTSLFLLALAFATGPAAALAADRSIVVATYKYPDIERRQAVAPIADLAANVTGEPVVIRLADTPTELAAWTIAGDVQIAVPNLVAYLAMKARSDSIVELAVPAVGPGGGNTYSSSVIVPNVSPFAGLADLRNAGTPPTLIMVWPDSASGALVASARLRHELKADFASLSVEYAGSHRNVLQAVAGRPDGVGVLASKVYLDYVASAAVPAVREIWRSEPIPFGPLVCSSVEEALCDRLRQRLLRHSAESAAILRALEDGWPEFAGASGFEQPAASRYEPLIEAYALIEQAGDEEAR